MAFRDIDYPDVIQSLGLPSVEFDLFADVVPSPVTAEFIIAILLLEFRRLLRLHPHPFQTANDLIASVVAIVEAKNDNIRNGLGQCIAAMVGAREYNAHATVAVLSIDAHNLVRCSGLAAGYAWVREHLGAEPLDDLLSRAESALKRIRAPFKFV